MVMKRIVLTGGGSGGHLFPLLAIADALQKSGTDLELVYLGPRDQYRPEFLKRDIRTYSIVSSKLRRYFSLANVFDFPKFLVSFFQALLRLYFLMPDAVFSKGGPGALPVVLAAKFYMIPIVIHESDTVPGLTNKISGKLAKKIDLSFEESAVYFKGSKITIAGNPVRTALMEMVPSKEVARERFSFDKTLPLILVLGGSQGATRINQFIFDNFEPLLKESQICHQVGAANFEEAKLLVSSLSGEMSSLYSSRYKLFGFMEAEEMKYALAAADIVFSRSGSGSIFETAFFGKPSILVPLPEAAGDHQKMNAYAYAKTGAAFVIESDNLKLDVVLIKIKDILSAPGAYERMSAAAKGFAKPDAAAVIAKDILSVSAVN